MTTWLDDLHAEQGMTEGAKRIYRRMVNGLDKQEDLISDDGWTVESMRFDKVAQCQRGAMAELQMEVDRLRAQNDKLLPKVERQAAELTKLRLALEQRNGDLRAYKAQCNRLAREYAWCQSHREALSLDIKQLRGENEELLDLVARFRRVLHDCGAEWHDCEECGQWRQYPDEDGYCSLMHDASRVLAEVDE